MSELKQIAQMGKELYDAEAEVLRIEAELKKAKRNLYQVQEVDIPELMAEIGLTRFETDDIVVEVKESLRVSPLAANRPKVMAVVEEAGDAALIKDTISFAFTRGQHEDADAFYEEAIANGFAPKRDQKIESATLRAYISGKLKAGEEVDTELFGVTTARKAIFKSGAPVAPVFE